MLRALAARLAQGHRTVSFPPSPEDFPARFRGRPVLDRTACPDGCRACVDACPTGAIDAGSGTGPETLRLDLGRCLFCTDCEESCPEGAIHHARDWRLAVRAREDLVLKGAALENEAHEGQTLRLARALDRESRRLFGRSLKLRQVSAGGCNGCELDVNVLGTVVFDMGRFGIQFVASPRHADGLLVTGPVTENMREALRRTWEAVPPPRLVIAVGACAISGGPYAGHPEVHDGAASTVPVDLFVPGCPPHPHTILDGLLRLLGRVKDASSGAGPGRTSPAGAVPGRTST